MGEMRLHEGGDCGPIAAEDEQVRGHPAWAIALPVMLSTLLELAIRAWSGATAADLMG